MDGSAPSPDPELTGARGALPSRTGGRDPAVEAVVKAAETAGPLDDGQEAREDAAHRVLNGKGDLRALVCRLAALPVHLACPHCHAEFTTLVDAADHFDPKHPNACTASETWEVLAEVRRVPPRYDRALRLASILLAGT